jgi:DNA primase
MDEREEIRERLDVAEVISGYIPIKPAGRSFKAICPFHAEKTPSLMITPDKGIWHCFGCHRGGDIFAFVMEMEGLSFPEALKMMADRAGVKLPERTGSRAAPKDDRSFEALSLATRYYEKALSSKAGAAATAYIKERGITEESSKEFRLGFSPDKWDALTLFMLGKGFSEKDLIQAGLSSKGKKGPIDRFRGRLMLPIWSPTGKVVGFGGRIMPGAKDGAKYINSAESQVYHKSEIIYGFTQARDAIREADRAVIVEGYFDVILSHQTGVKNVVASSGTALTQQQLRRLSRIAKTIVLAFDPDSAGEQATQRAIELAGGFDISLFVIALPKGVDPADLALTKPDEWKQMAGRGAYVMDYLFEKALGEQNITSGIGKKRAAAKLTPYIGLLKDPIEQAHYVRLLSDRLGVPENDVRRAIGKDAQPATEAEVEAEPLDDPTGPVTEARLLSLMLTLPMPLAPIFAVLDPLAFTDTRYQTLYTALKDRYNDDSQGALPDADQFSPDLRDTAHFLILSADYVSEHTTARAEDEVLFCVNRLRQEYLHSLQQRLERALRQAESRSDRPRQEEILQKLNRVIAEAKRRVEIDFSLQQ